MENSSKKLYDIIENLLKEKVVLAFSGGVDSCLLYTSSFLVLNLSRKIPT